MSDTLHTDTLHMKNKETGAHDMIVQQELTQKDWGFSFFVDSEAEAFKAVYEYRHNKHGYEVKFAGGVERWMVTVFNATGAEIFA